MQTQTEPKAEAHADATELGLTETDLVGGGKYVTFTAHGNRYFRDSWSGRIGVEDSASGTSHWL